MGVPGICHAATAVTSGAKRGVFFDFDSTMRLGSKQLNMYILREFTLSLLFFPFSVSFSVFLLLLLMPLLLLLPLLVPVLLYLWGLLLLLLLALLLETGESTFHCAAFLLLLPAFLT